MDTTNKIYSRVGNDVCNVNQKNQGNDKKLKYFTTNHADLLQANATQNFFTIGKTRTLGADTKGNLIVPALTNERYRTDLGTLPVNLGLRTRKVDPVQEANVRGFGAEETKNSVVARSQDFYTRSFTIFTGNMEVPSALKSVEKKEDGFKDGRAGTSTRF